MFWGYLELSNGWDKVHGRSILQGKSYKRLWIYLMFQFSSFLFRPAAWFCMQVSLMIPLSPKSSIGDPLIRGMYLPFSFFLCSSLLVLLLSFWVRHFEYSGRQARFNPFLRTFHSIKAHIERCGDGLARWYVWCIQDDKSGVGLWKDTLYMYRY